MEASPFLGVKVIQDSLLSRNIRWYRLRWHPRSLLPGYLRDGPTNPVNLHTWKSLCFSIVFEWSLCEREYSWPAAFIVYRTAFYSLSCRVSAEKKRRKITEMAWEVLQAIHKPEHHLTFTGLISHMEGVFFLCAYDAFHRLRPPVNVGGLSLANHALGALIAV